MRAHRKAKRWPVIGAACCALWASRAHAQPEDKSRPLAIIPPIVVAPVAGVAPAGVTAPVAGVAPVGAKAGEKDVAAIVVTPVKSGMPLEGQVRRMATLLQLQAGTLTPEEAWQKGDLTYDNIADFFQNETGDWVIVEKAEDSGLHYALLSLLLRHKSDRLKDLSKVPQKLRLWLSDYFGSQRDKRVTDVVDSIIREFKMPVKEEQVILIQAIERLSWFYEANGDDNNALKAWQQMTSLSDQEGWWTMDGYLGQAQCYYRQGNFSACASYASKSLNISRRIGSATVEQISQSLLSFCPMWGEKIALFPEFDWILTDEEPSFQCGKRFDLYCRDEESVVSTLDMVKMTVVKQNTNIGALFTVFSIKIDQPYGVQIPDAVHLEVNSKRMNKRQVITLRSSK